MKRKLKKIAKKVGRRFVRKTTSTLTTPSGGREDGGRDYDDGTSNAPQPMHAYFKKFPSKEAALLKPHPDTTEEQWKELCDLFTSEAFMKRSEQNKKNRSKLTVNHAAGSRSFQHTRACMEWMDAFQRQCDLEGKTYTEIEVYFKILGKKSGYVRGLGRAVKLPPSSTLTTQSSDLQHQLAKARDEIEA
ncbi:hypothetical protein CJ030_MR7G027605 [Morella rubra]|uniref:Uncharacterized protein n=1 Tax=Morella rubra TaxID=262757 RepID=A0A6A1V178_9ROSI|nr:hypothetical protein CJ030_MR7G027605 [Morella rubra]